MNRIELAKTAANLAVTFGASKIIKTIIHNNVQPETLIDQITVTAGSIAIGGLVAEASANYTDRRIDQAVAWYNAKVQTSTK